MGSLTSRPPEVRVAVDRTAHCAWRSGHSSMPVRNRPTHQAVDRHSGIGTHAVLVQPLNRSAAWPDDQPRTPASGPPARSSRHREARWAPGVRRQRVTARSSSLELRVSSNHSAGPPTRNVVSGARGGASACTVCAKCGSERVGERRHAHLASASRSQASRTKGVHGLGARAAHELQTISPGAACAATPDRQ